MLYILPELIQCGWLNCVHPSKKETLIPSTPEYDLIRRQGLERGNHIKITLKCISLAVSLSLHSYIEICQRLGKQWPKRHSLGLHRPYSCPFSETCNDFLLLTKSSLLSMPRLPCSFPPTYPFESFILTISSPRAILSSCKKLYLYSTDLKVWFNS